MIITLTIACFFILSVGYAKPITDAASMRTISVRGIIIAYRLHVPIIIMQEVLLLLL